MKYILIFFVVIITTFYITISNAEDLIVYINMEKIMNESVVGKSITSQLEKIHKSNLKEFKTTEEKLKNEETQIISQKNILTKEDFTRKVDSLRAKVEKYKQDRQNKINSLTEKRISASTKLLNEINPILTEYSKENKISIILHKKNIILGKTQLDITKEIIEITNSKIKKINLN